MVEPLLSGSGSRREQVHVAPGSHGQPLISVVLAFPFVQLFQKCTYHRKG